MDEKVEAEKKEEKVQNVDLDKQKVEEANE